MSQTFTPPAEFEIRAEEARMLRERAVASARSVLILVALIAISLASVHLYWEALIWTGLASGMVAITVVYARYWQNSEDTPLQVRRYLLGHSAISAITGLLWAMGAVQLASPVSELQTFLAGLFLTSITAGGVMAGTVYRPGYLAIAFFSVLPFSLYLLVTMEGGQRIYGGFLLFYLSFCFTTNKTASQKTREALAANLTSRKAEKALEAFSEAAKLQGATKRSLKAIRHDMAQPLLALHNFLAEMERKATTPEQQVLVRQIRLALNSQEALVAELANVDQPASDPVRSAINVAELVTQLDDEYRPQFAAVGCEFAINFEVDVVESDRSKLERVLRNFLSNAVKYGASGGRVELSIFADGTDSFWQVTDQGEGMTDAQLRAVQRGTDLGPTFRGSGLGLGIVRQLSDELGGTFKISSSVETGTQVSLSLPGSIKATALQNAFVLIIGQETLPEMGAWADLISSWAWKFAHAETEIEAMRLLSVLGQEPDLIVLDLAVGQKLSGEELNSLRQHAPILQLMRARQTDVILPNQKFITLPDQEADLRCILEHHLQNSANSRAL